jgi:4-amino-4-deoxy-L-arabinose transferase-like glycosyltransferase
MTKKRDRKGRTSAGKRGGIPGVRPDSVAPRVVLALIIILVAGAALRGVYLHELTATPDFEYPLVDSDYHDYWARGMAFGNWASPRFEPDPELQEHPYFRPPGYPYLLSLVYRIVGRGYVGPRVVQMLVGLANAALAFFIARRLFGDAAALIAAALMSLYWAFVYFEGEFLEPAFTILLMLAVVRVLMGWVERTSAVRMLVAGALMGALALVRPNALLLVPVVAWWAVWVLRRRAPGRRVLAGLALLFAGTVIVVAPVTIRNYSVGHEFVPISSNGGVNLYIGNNDRADGLVRGTMPGIGTLDTSFDHLEVVAGIERLTGRSMKHSEVSDYLAAEALTWMRRNPGRVLGLMWKKTLLFWGPTEPADNKVVAGDRVNSAVLRSIPLTFSLVLGLAVAGVFLFFFEARRGRSKSGGEDGGRGDNAGRTRREAVILILWLALLWYASHLPFAVTARYRVPVIPFMLIFAGLFLERLWTYLRAKDWKRGGVWAAVFAVAMIPASIDFVPDDEPSMARWHYQRGIAYTRAGRLDTAAGEYERALEINPDYTAVHNDLAAALAGQGRVSESVPHFRKALLGRPNDGTLHFNLALALELTGEFEESLFHYREALRIRPGDREAAAGLERTSEALSADG